MSGSDVKVKSSEGSEFDCYLATPESGTGPGVIVVAAVTGVGPDMREMTDDLAAHGFVAAAPDMFWRTDPGYIERTDETQPRIQARTQPREEIINTGIQDVADMRDFLKGHGSCNGKVAAIGFCYGGPYALIGTARLGLDAGCSYHGTNMGAYKADLEKSSQPILIHWGDQDHAAPPELVAEYQDYAAKMDNLSVHIFPGVKHGYMMTTAPAAYDADAYRHSWDATLSLLGGLK
ncbi:MAG: dienelactone hydrolase family protein [Proteobacteria bacterium]|nr:dienelactone hydrolase family protein [Pseudomonadota bacterium]